MGDKYDAKARKIATAESWRYSNAHGCQIEEGFLADLISSALRSAAAEEREACAKIAVEHRRDGIYWNLDTCEAIASSIRSRGIPND